MHLTKEQIGALTARLSTTRISDRRGAGGRSLSYLEAWDVKAALIRVFGFGGFSAETIEAKILKMEDDVPNKTGGGTQFRVTALCTVRLTIHGRVDVGEPDAVYTESAVSSQNNPEPGEAADFAVKTAESDALKRAATYLGTQFGLSLYASDKTHVHTADVVGTILEPTQKALLEEYRAAKTAEHQALQERAQGLADRATGQTEEAKA